MKKILEHGLSLWFIVFPEAAQSNQRGWRGLQRPSHVLAWMFSTGFTLLSSLLNGKWTPDLSDGYCSPGQHSNRYILGKFIIWCTLHHATSAIASVSHGERKKWAPLLSAHLPKTPPLFRWVSSRAAPWKQCYWLLVLAHPIGSQMQSALFTNKNLSQSSTWKFKLAWQTI